MHVRFPYFAVYFAVHFAVQTEHGKRFQITWALKQRI